MIKGNPQRIGRDPRTSNSWELLSPFCLMGQEEVVPVVCPREDHLTGDVVCCMYYLQLPLKEEMEDKYPVLSVLTLCPVFSISHC